MPENPVIHDEELKKREEQAAYETGYRDGRNGERLYETSISYMNGYTEGRKERKRLGLLRSFSCECRCQCEECWDQY